MRSAVGAFVFGLLGSIGAFGQVQHFLYICDLVNGCYPINTLVMGGLRFEDYKVTNPAAVQFDPVQRIEELAALGPSTANTLCAAPPVFTTPAPSIAFDKNTVVAPAASFSASEFMDVQVRLEGG